MKFIFRALTGIFLWTIAASSLSAGEVILYGGTQKPGELSWSNAGLSEVVADLKGDFGGTFGFRYSAGRIVGFEQSIGYSPRFAKPGVRAFQTDSNLLIQFPGKIVPYGTFGIGLVRSWGRGDFPESLDAGEIASFVFSLGNNFALNYGGGLKLRRLWGPLGVNIDVRGYTLPSAEAIVRSTLDKEYATKKGLSFIQTTAGLTITW
jgi:hypothetical protein